MHFSWAGSSTCQGADSAPHPDHNKGSLSILLCILQVSKFRTSEQVGLGLFNLRTTGERSLTGTVAAHADMPGQPMLTVEPVRLILIIQHQCRQQGALT